MRRKPLVKLMEPGKIPYQKTSIFSNHYEYYKKEKVMILFKVKYLKVQILQLTLINY